MNVTLVPVSLLGESSWLMQDTIRTERRTFLKLTDILFEDKKIFSI
jgi:hypothetical protein